MRISKSIGLAVATFIAGAAGTSWSAPPPGVGGGVSSDIEALQAEVAALQALLAGVTRLTDPATGQDTLRFSAMNVQVVNGTDDTETTNGVGNVIIGYDELLDPSMLSNRSGSHMLVVGLHHRYSSYGGVIVGSTNRTAAPFASVTSGTFNEAHGLGASVTGGLANHAMSDYSSVSGGQSNHVEGQGFSSITGGLGNQIYDGYACSITGGAVNVAYGSYATVSGGTFRIAFGDYDWLGGGLFEDF